MRVRCSRAFRLLSYLAFIKVQFTSERTFPRKRFLFPWASKIPAWLFPSPYWPRLHLGQYVGSEKNRRYFLILPSENKVFFAFTKNRTNHHTLTLSHSRVLALYSAPKWLTRNIEKLSTTMNENKNSAFSFRERKEVRRRRKWKRKR